MSGTDRLPTITACYYTDIAGSGYPFSSRSIAWKPGRQWERRDYSGLPVLHPLRGQLKLFKNRS
jgi:hypothetical protein